MKLNADGSFPKQVQATEERTVDRWRPGSPAAVSRGCTCCRHANRYGAGRNEGQMFIVRSTCLLHNGSISA